MRTTHFIAILESHSKVEKQFSFRKNLVFNNNNNNKEIFSLFCCIFFRHKIIQEIVNNLFNDDKDEHDAVYFTGHWQRAKNKANTIN